MRVDFLRTRRTRVCAEWTKSRTVQKVIAVSLRVAATRAVSWTFVESVGSKLVSFLLFTVLARLVAPADFGVVQMAQTVTGIAWILAEQGVSAYLVQKRELTPEILNTVFWTSMVLACLVAGLVIVAAPYVSKAYAASDVLPVLRAIVVFIPVGALGWVHNALLSRELAFGAVASRRLIAICVSGAGGVILAVQGFGVWSLVGKQALETVLLTALTWLLCPWRPGLKVDTGEMGPLFRAGAKLTAGNLIGQVSYRADDILVGLYLGPTALGYYSVALRAMVLAQEVAVSTAQRAALPVFAKLQHDVPRLASAYCSALVPAAAISIPVFLGISASAPELCSALFGQEWLPAVPAMRVLGVAGVAIGGSIFFSPLALGTGRTQLFTAWQFIAAPINFIALLVGVQFGLLGVAAATLVRAYIWLGASLWTAKRILSFPLIEHAKVLAAPTSCSVFMYACVLGARAVLPAATSPFTLPVLALVGAASYILGMSVLSRRTVRTVYQLATSMLPQRTT